MLRTITEKRKQQVKSILDSCTHVEVWDNGVHATDYNLIKNKNIGKRVTVQFL